jgi:hypothetical protein
LPGVNHGRLRLGQLGDKRRRKRIRRTFDKGRLVGRQCEASPYRAVREDVGYAGGVESFHMAMRTDRERIVNGSARKIPCLNAGDPAVQRQISASRFNFAMPSRVDVMPRP